MGRVKFGRIAAIALGAWLGIQSSACDTDNTPDMAAQVSIVVTPKRSVGPWAAFRVVTTVERDAHNRWLTVVVDGDRYYRSSTGQLDGEDAARVRAVIYDNIPVGHYTLTATVTRNDGTTLRAEDTACVGSSEDCDQ